MSAQKDLHQRTRELRSTGDFRDPSCAAILLAEADESSDFRREARLVTGRHCAAVCRRAQSGAMQVLRAQASASEPAPNWVACDDRPMLKTLKNRLCVPSPLTQHYGEPDPVVSQGTQADAHNLNLLAG